MIRSRDESLFHQRMMIFYFFWKNDFHHETCSLSQIVDTTKIFEDVYRCHNLASARTLARPAVLLPLANNQPPMYTARLESECIAAIKLDTPAIQDLSLLYVWEGFGSLWKLSHSLSLFLPCCSVTQVKPKWACGRWFILVQLFCCLTHLSQ